MFVLNEQTCCLVWTNIIITNINMILLSYYFLFNFFLWKRFRDVWSGCIVQNSDICVVYSLTQQKTQFWTKCLVEISDLFGRPILDFFCFVETSVYSQTRGIIKDTT